MAFLARERLSVLARLGEEGRLEPATEVKNFAA